MDRREFVRSAAIITGAAGTGICSLNAFAKQLPDSGLTEITVQPQVVTNDFPHVWEECVGSDRANVGLRAQWLSDLERVHKEAGIKRVRFHGLFDDEMGVWPLGAKSPNFLYIDMVFDAIVERGVKPFVELGFMPGKLASGKSTVFFYKGNITPPSEVPQWTELITAFAKHLIERYGLDEIRTWDFEVWNEPNLPFFWTATKDDYFALYKAAAEALKSVDRSLRVGGPATARAAWVADLLSFCGSQHVPIDFVTTHIYPDDPQDIVFEKGTHYSFEEVIPRALAKLKAQITASSFPNLPLYITEWTSQNPAFIAHTVKGTLGLAEVMSYWTFDSVYEELGIAKTFMNTSFGLIAMRGVPRPSFHTFVLLHRLGNKFVSATEGPIMATRRDDGSLALMVWNLIPQPPGQRSATGDPAIQNAAQYDSRGATKTFSIAIPGLRKNAKCTVARVDENNGSLRRAYEAIGSPAYPTMLQIQALKQKTALPPPEAIHLVSGRLSIAIPPNGIALIEIA